MSIQVADTCVDVAELDKYDSIVQLAFAHVRYVMFSVMVMNLKLHSRILM